VQANARARLNMADEFSGDSEGDLDHDLPNDGDLPANEVEPIMHSTKDFVFDIKFFLGICTFLCRHILCPDPHGETLLNS
jgi:hypothetical protein